MTTSEQLEREAEETRAQISSTLDELRARVTPGHMVDQLVDYANDSTGGMFFRNLQQQIAANPLPVALMGTGLAWLAMSNRRARTNADSRANRLASKTRERFEDASEQVRNTARRAGGTIRETTNEWSDQAGSVVSEVQDASRTRMASALDSASEVYDGTAERAGQAAARIKESARAAADSLAETAGETYDAAAERARRASNKLKESASRMGGNLAGTGSNIKSFLNDQPLVLAGIGLAIGAIIGAALPSTAAEDELMGEESEALKQKAAEFAEEQLDKGKAVGERALESAKQEAEQQGFVSDTEGRSRPTHSRGSDGPLRETTGEQASLVPAESKPEAQPAGRSEP
jgi:hypothetical protein